MVKEQHTLDAAGQSVGRVSSQAAKILMGKHRPDFKQNTIAPVVVTIVNASKASITPKKIVQKEYLSYSGYPGGQTRRSMRKVLDDKGYREVFRRAVYGMLPANKLRKQLMKQLVVEN